MYKYPAEIVKLHTTIAKRTIDIKLKTIFYLDLITELLIIL
jgi:hypothetical protein